MLWLFYAWGAAILWGFDYAVGERVLKAQISPFTLMLLEMGFSTFALTLFNFKDLGRRFGADCTQIMGDPSLIRATAAAMVSFALGNILIFLSIIAKNATIAGLIELSYPIFTALFALVLFRDNQISPMVLVGGAFILVGALIISYFGTRGF